jgi:lipopolysaccharide/colanic/teichoic acid biosynthesis glycosyltransferase
VRHERPILMKQRSLFTRRRFQFAGALVIAAILPFVLRSTVLPGIPGEAASVNSLIGNLAAITLAFWMRLSLETYPGIRSTYVIFPAALTAHGLVIATYLLTRLPYDRLGIAMGFSLNVLWSYFLFFYAERKIQPRIGIVPFGAVAGLASIDDVEWLTLARPQLADAAGCHALVADFSADLPDEWEAFLADAALAGRIVYQVKQLAESLTGQVELTHLSENSFGSLLPARGWFHLKAVADFLFALLLLPIALPVMAIAAAAIRFESSGPILFRQKRVGHAGRPIIVYKFRTMHDVTPDEDDADYLARRKRAMTSDNDGRITGVGRILRQTRIDELPQIFNILRWQMSWIGPRPEAEILASWYTAELPYYRYRHVVKPGISGWAQVNQGHVAEVEEVHRKLHYDFYYIKYFSPWLDLLILFRTIKTMLSGFGAR